jgi:uncharacterized protein with HEPN domain
MTRHDDRTRLRHMLDYAEEAVSLAQGHDRGDLDTDRLLRHALTHVVEVVGEAAAHVSELLRQAHADIPWGEIVSLRNRLIHGYDKVDLDVLWQIVQGDLPPLIADLKRVLRSLAE